jgi:hypothetical protein
VLVDAEERGGNAKFLRSLSCPSRVCNCDSSPTRRDELVRQNLFRLAQVCRVVDPEDTAVPVSKKKLNTDRMGGGGVKSGRGGK